MRKLLMASGAILGASASLAFAQTQVPANPSQGQLAAPYAGGGAANNNNNAWGIANTPSGSAAAGGLSTYGALGQNFDAVPAPGTVVIRLNGRVEVDVGAVFTSADKGVTATGAPTGFKTNPVGIGGYMRLYPAFDGVAANGLRYGASVELRENFNSGVFTGSQTSTVSSTATATSPSTNSSAQTVFVRRAFTYLANDNVGLVRFGQTDGVLGLFDNCIFTTQCWDAGIGDFNGGANQSISPQAGVGIPFVWLSQAGAEYANQKIVYLSPQIYGLDFGVQYAPSMGNAFQDSGAGVGCNQASASCIGLTSGNDATRWYNQFGVGLRYEHTFGPVDVKAYGFWETAGKENLDVGSYITPATARATAAGTNALRYDNLNFYKAGLAVTTSGLTYAIDYIGGRINGQLAMDPSGGVPMNAVLTGLTYVNGPMTLGAEIGMINSQGDARLVGISQRRETEIAFGGNYKLAPGLNLVGEYMYEYRHQGGYDFANGGLGAGTTATTPGLTRDAHGQSVVFSTVLTW